VAAGIDGDQDVAEQKTGQKQRQFYHFFDQENAQKTELHGSGRGDPEIPAPETQNDSDHNQCDPV